MEGLRADIHHSRASPFCEAPSIKQVAARPESRRFYRGKPMWRQYLAGDKAQGTMQQLTCPKHMGAWISFLLLHPEQHPAGGQHGLTTTWATEVFQDLLTSSRKISLAASRRETVKNLKVKPTTNEISFINWEGYHLPFTMGLGSVFFPC